MTIRTRLPAILFLALPLAACAAQPAPAVPAAAPAAKSAAVQDAQAPTAGAAPAAAAPAPAVAPAGQPDAAAQPDRGTAPSSRSAGSGARTPAESAAAAPAGAAPTVPAPAANAPAVNPANPALPETTVGGGAANRPVVPAAPVTMPTGSATGSLLQTLFALIAVLAVLGALAWFLKRYGPKAMGGGANLRVVGSLNLGGRERLLVVEVGDQWIVVGASPGRVNALATMPKQEAERADMASAGATLAAGQTTAQPANSFADWLKQTIDKRK